MAASPPPAARPGSPPTPASPGKSSSPSLPARNSQIVLKLLSFPCCEDPDDYCEENFERSHDRPRLHGPGPFQRFPPGGTLLRLALRAAAQGDLRTQPRNPAGDGLALGLGRDRHRLASCGGTQRH